MSGLWIRIDADEVNGERVAVLVTELEIDPITALGHLVAFSGKVAHHRPDGVISDVAPVLLEKWAEWRGEPGVFAHTVLAFLCDPPGELREWADTMGELIARRKKERERKAEARRLEKLAREADQLRLEGVNGAAGAEAAATVPAVSADSPRKSRPTERNGTVRDGTNGESHSTGPDGGAPGKAAAHGSARGGGKVLAADPGRADALAGLPPSAVRLLTLFYANATPKRKRDVLEQLRDTIDPVRPGARLDRNTMVRAHDVDQLEAACARILRTPPRDLDLGVRFVLHELTTLEKRRTIAATEGQADRERVEEARLEAWRRARAIEVSKWERANPEKAEELRAQVEKEIPEAARTRTGDFGRRVALEHYAQLAAELARFPSADKWVPALPPPRRGLTPIGEVSPR